MKHTFYLLIALFLLLAACKKDPDSGPSSAQGAVVDATTQQPVPFARVALARRPSGIVSSVGYSQLQNVQADAQGRYSLSFEASEDYEYALFGIAPRYLESVTPTFLERGKKNNVNVPIQPEGYVRLHIKNITPFDQGDEFVFTNDSYPQPRFIGAAIETTLVVTTNGNLENQLTWIVTKNFIQQAYSQTIYTPAHDTTDFQINY